jgi:hypothetical protein
MCLHLQAQVPGYMGKRGIVSYEFSLSPFFSNAIYGPGYTGPRISHAIRFEYVTGERGELVTAVRYCTDQVDNASFTQGRSLRGVPDANRANFLDFVFGWKKFRRGKFAPLGNYHRWEFYYCNGWINYPSIQEVNNDGNYFNIAAGKLKFKSFGFSYSIGKQRVYNDKYLFDFGLKASLYPYFGYNGGNDYANHLGKDATSGLAAYPAATGYLSLGFLAF